MTKPQLFLLILIFWRAAHADAQERPYVILISFDGFRYDYMSKFETPNFHQFIEAGASAESLIPSFPSKTFPNHYTLVTGMYPGHHGLVDNEFYDPLLKKTYGMRKKDAVSNSAFYGGTPLWQLAQRQGVKTASYFWVGSETPIQGEHPTYYFPYDESVPNQKRIDQAIAWLKLPEVERPHLITLYFSLVDTEGHNTGTNSEKLSATVQQADAILGELMAKLKSLSLPVNVVIVSDHGMLELKQVQESYITLARFIDLNNSSVKVINAGTQAHLYTNKVDSLQEALQKQSTALHFNVYRRKDFPPSWHYDHPRAGDLLLVAKPGFYFQMADKPFGTVKLLEVINSPVFGVHGYDPLLVKEMHGILYASGPHIRAGARLPSVENVHVYPLIAALLQLDVPPGIDGKLAVVKEMLLKERK